MMTIKVVSFNIHKGIGWGHQVSPLPSLRDHFRELHPDIILIQETQGAQFEFIAEDIWPHFSYGKNAVYPKGHHGNAIISKFPIDYSYNLDLTTGRLDRRGLLHCIVTHPHFQKIHLLCVHLGLFKSDRRKQFTRIFDYLADSVSPQDLIIFGGDFNDWSGAVTEPLIKEYQFQEAFLKLNGHYARTFPARAPFFRLDRMYYRGFTAIKAQCLIDSSWRILSDHLAIEVDLKRSENRPP